VSGVDLGQQGDVCGRIALREARPLRRPPFDRARLFPAADQARQLRPAQTGRFEQKAPHDPFLAFVAAAVLLFAQHPFDEPVAFGRRQAELQAAAAAQELLHPGRAQLFEISHGQGHPLPA